MRDRPASRPRVLLYSQRNVFTYMWEVPQAEFEDVIMQVDDAELIAPTAWPAEQGPVSSTTFAGRATRWGQVAAELGGRFLSGVRESAHRPKRWPVGPVTVDRDYDLFFATFHFPRNISVVERLRDVRRRCRTMACFLVECWTPQIAANRHYLRLLDQFDHVFLFNAASVRHVQAETSAQCHFLPTAVDAFRFSPFPLDVDRTVDVYNIGRVSPSIHRQLCAMAARDALHYVHATVNHEVPDYLAHRVQVANLLKRARYFFAHKINEGRRDVTGGEEALATRYFEGAAAGAVMLGSRPDCSEFDELFPWQDAVIPVNWEAYDVGAVLRDLDRQPERLARIRRDAVAHSLRTHDWVHRWARILDTVGLSQTPAMRARATALETLAGNVDDGRWHDPARELAWTPAARGLLTDDAAEAFDAPREAVGDVTDLRLSRPRAGSQSKQQPRRA